MSINVSVFLFHKPEAELGPLQPEQDFPERLHQRAEELGHHLHQVADLADRLLKDGWSADLLLYTLQFTNPAVTSTKQAEQRLRSLGIDPGLCDIEEDDEEEED